MRGVVTTLARNVHTGDGVIVRSVEQMLADTGTEMGDWEFTHGFLSLERAMDIPTYRALILSGEVEVVDREEDEG